MNRDNSFKGQKGDIYSGRRSYLCFCFCLFHSLSYLYIYIYSRLWSLARRLLSTNDQALTSRPPTLSLSHTHAYKLAAAAGLSLPVLAFAAPKPLGSSPPFFAALLFWLSFASNILSLVVQRPCCLLPPLSVLYCIAHPAVAAAMEVELLPVAGAFVVHCVRHSDVRGFFQEVFRHSKGVLPGAPWKQVGEGGREESIVWAACCV